MHGLFLGRDPLSLALQFALTCILVAVSTLSVQLAVLAWVRVFRKSPSLTPLSLPDRELPHVLVQLPVCNEGLLAVRVVEAASRMDWPKIASPSSFWMMATATAMPRWRATPWQ